MNQKHMDCISLGIYKHFKTKRGRTWHEAPCTMQRALPTKDIPSISAADELALSWFRAHPGKCSHLFWAERGEFGRESHQLLLVKCHRATEPPRIISYVFLRLPTLNGRHLKYVLSQSSANIQQSWYVLPWELAKAQMESAWKLWLGTDLAWIQGNFPPVGLHWWYSPDLLIRTSWSNMNKSWRVGGMGKTVV